MSTLTYLTTLVQQAISRLNNYEANAKKVGELPHQTNLNTASKIPVDRAGISEYITVDQIASAIQNGNYNQLLAIGAVSVNELTNEITVASGVTAQINGSIYQTTTDTTIPITLCPAGFSRKDILVLTTSNTVIAIPGEETDGAIVLAPPVPIDAIYITEFDVNDTAIGTPSDPILGSQFKQKIENLSYTYSDDGENVILPLRGEGQNHYIVDNEDLVSLDGFDKSVLILVRNSEAPYEGKDYLFENKSPNPIQLNHLTSAEIPFSLPNEENLIVPSGGAVWFKFKGEQMAYIMKSWNDPVDLSSKADLVGGKVPASQLPAYVDDVLEFANLAAFPATGETEKIYVALDTNFTYRWSGSAYVKISDSGKLDKVTTGSVRRVYGVDASNNQEMIPVSELGGGSFDQSTWMFSDFHSDNVYQPPFTGGALSGGSKDAASYSDSTQDFLGSFLLFSGTSANGGYRVLDFFNPAYGCFRNGAGLTFFGVFRLLSQSDARDRIIRIGFHNAVNHVAPADGAFLEILGSTATFKTRNNNVESSSSSVTLSSGSVTGGVFYKVLIEFISTTSVNCKVVDNSGNVVLNVNNTTNLPTTGRRFGCGITATITTAGASHQIAQIDYMGVGRQKPNFLNGF